MPSSIQGFQDVADTELVPIVLASTSPRRKALLEQVGLVFTTTAIDIDESAHAAEFPADYVVRLARQKALAAVPDFSPQTLIIAADTTVTIDGLILAKPTDREHAFSMWKLLSGRTHQVMTGVAVACGEEIVTCNVVTEVDFLTLTIKQMQMYWDTGEPLGKAGGYAIQGYGAAFIPRINGSYSNVVGLPLVETLALINHFK
jgi:septum formation protein